MNVKKTIIGCVLIAFTLAANVSIQTANTILSENVEALTDDGLDEWGVDYEDYPYIKVPNYCYDVQGYTGLDIPIDWDQQWLFSTPPGAKCSGNYTYGNPIETCYIINGYINIGALEYHQN